MGVESLARECIFVGPSAKQEGKLKCGQQKEIQMRAYAREEVE